MRLAFVESPAMLTGRQHRLTTPANLRDLMGDPKREPATMFLVEIRIPSKATLPQRMTTMRLWLDHNRCEPNMFRCTHTGVGIVCRVEFKAEAEADAFARAFDGKVKHLAAIT
jgi:hypothetical protein